ncbi:hypothetical protein GCM10009764_07640 [Nocardia ninae]|uniref:Uncharacterized protein n=1 Tax=Nocardia ninae NBRC 108245 TaxID=1210091 RepID=A0A511MAX4_9NOCA|nr:hypothetical protein NN4_22790 [Nocardia ninae NBRC 108245]
MDDEAAVERIQGVLNALQVLEDVGVRPAGAQVGEAIGGHGRLPSSVASPEHDADPNVGLALMPDNYFRGKRRSAYPATHSAARSTALPGNGTERFAGQPDRRAQLSGAECAGTTTTAAAGSVNRRHAVRIS